MRTFGQTGKKGQLGGTMVKPKFEVTDEEYELLTKQAHSKSKRVMLTTDLLMRLMVDHARLHAKASEA